MSLGLGLKLIKPTFSASHHQGKQGKGRWRRRWRKVSEKDEKEKEAKTRIDSGGRQALP